MKKLKMTQKPPAEGKIGVRGVEKMEQLRKKQPKNMGVWVCMCQPKRRRKKDYANPNISAKSRKNRVAHPSDITRYKESIRMSPAFLHDQRSILAPNPPSPLRNQHSSPPETSAPTTLSKNWNRRGGRPKKKRLKRGPGRKKNAPENRTSGRIAEKRKKKKHHKKKRKS